MMQVSSRARAVPQSGIRELMRLAAGLDCIHLEVGDPDFDTPRHVVDAAHAAASSGRTHYAPNAGLWTLREALAEKLRRTNGLDVVAEQVVVTAGSTEALFSCILALVDPADEVLIPDPGWPNFEQMVVAAGGIPVRYGLSVSDGFQPDLDSMERAITPATRLMIVNSPSNPTGAVFTSDNLRGIARIARRHDLFVISDECYEQVTFERQHESLAAYAGMDRTVVTHSFSKTYAMTGWRVGYAVAPREVADVMTRLQEPIVSCASTISQVAAEAALKGPQDDVRVMRDRYRARRDLAVEILERAGLLVAKPEGSFYVMAHIGQADSYGFARALLQSAMVATAPGETFGPAGRAMVRLSLVVPEEVLAVGLKRFVDFVQLGSPSVADETQPQVARK